MYTFQLFPFQERSLKRDRKLEDWESRPILAHFYKVYSSSSDQCQRTGLKRAENEKSEIFVCQDDLKRFLHSQKSFRFSRWKTEKKVLNLKRASPGD